MDALKASLWSLQNVALQLSGWGGVGWAGEGFKGQRLELTALLLLEGNEEKPGVEGRKDTAFLLL